MDGVVRAPSEFSMTLGLPPSMMATQLLVVPRSMPMIFPMVFLFDSDAGLPAIHLFAIWGSRPRNQAALPFLGLETTTRAGRSTRSCSR